MALKTGFEEKQEAKKVPPMSLAPSARRWREGGREGERARESQRERERERVSESERDLVLHLSGLKCSLLHV